MLAKVHLTGQGCMLLITHMKKLPEGRKRTTQREWGKSALCTQGQELYLAPEARNFMGYQLEYDEWILPWSWVKWTPETMLLWPHPINIKSKTKKRIRVSPGNLTASKNKGQECFFEIQTAPNKVKLILSAMQPKIISRKLQPKMRRKTNPSNRQTNNKGQEHESKCEYCIPTPQ